MISVFSFNFWKDSRIFLVVFWLVSGFPQIIDPFSEKIKECWILGYAFLISVRALCKAIAEESLFIVFHILLDLRDL